MIRTVISWGTWRDQWERETFSPFSSLREKQGGCDRVSRLFASVFKWNNAVFCGSLAMPYFIFPGSMFLLYLHCDFNFDFIEPAEFWAILCFGFYVLLFLLCSDLQWILLSKIFLMFFQDFHAFILLLTMWVHVLDRTATSSHFTEASCLYRLHCLGNLFVILICSLISKSISSANNYH